MHLGADGDGVCVCVISKAAIKEALSATGAICKSCGKQYVGQTGDSIHKRFSGHIGSIRRKELQEDVGRHFNQPGHRGLDDIEIKVLDFIFVVPKTEHGLILRLQIEFNWIHRLRTMLPFGINTKDKTPLETGCRSWKHYLHNRIEPT